MEYIADAGHASSKDLPACQEKLKRLHALGIKHGDVNRHNFLIKGQEAILIDVKNANAKQCSDPDALQSELDSLAKKLDTSGRSTSWVIWTNGVIVENTVKSSSHSK